MFSFNLFAIPVRVEPWFWVTMTLLGYSAYGTHPLGIVLVLIFIVAGFISILVHELGHALAIRKFGQPTEITLHAFGGYATYPIGRLNRKQSFFVTAAGPGLQIALALILIILGRFIPIPPESLLNSLVTNLVGVSIIWALLNCLPIYPMDGGQMAAAMLGPRRESLVHLIGIFFAVLIGLASILYSSFLLLPVFMAFFAWQNWQAYKEKTRR